MSDFGMIGSVALGIIVGMGVAGATVARWFGPSLRKASHLVDDMLGEDARPGKARVPGVVEEIGRLRDRQEQIAAVAQTAADDAAAVRTELTRNGGDSTKDASFQSARSAEAAATAAELAARSAARTEALLRRHMENGLEIMEVGQHNDLQVLAAIESLGGSVIDYRPFPSVDIGNP
jgi:hypothetical protein